MIWSIIRHECRLLWNGRSTLLVPGLVLAVGVAGALALTRVVDTALLRPLPFPHGERLVAITPYQLTSGREFGRVPGELLEATHASDLVELVSTVSSSRDVWLTDGRAETLEIAHLSPHAQTIFGFRPLAGRLFTDDDFADHGAVVPALLTDSFWESRFGRDPTVLGRRLEGERRQFVVVGIVAATAPVPSFHGPLVPDVFAADLEGATDDYLLAPFARVKATVDLSSVATQLAGRLDAVRAAHPRLADVGLHVRPLRDQIHASDRPFHVLLGGAIVALLGIAACSVAILLTASARRRDREHAVRLTLGDTPGGLRRRLWIQVTLMTAAALPLTGVLAFVLVGLVETRVPVDIAGLALDIDPRRWAMFVVLQLVGTAVAACLLVTVAAYRTSQLEPRDGLSPSLRTTVARGLLGLVAVQATVTTTLLLLGATTARSAAGLATLDTGVVVDDLHVVTPRLPLERYREGAAAVRATFYAILERIEQEPGIESAALAYDMPMSGQTPWASLRGTEGTDVSALGSVVPVSREYFDTVGMQLIEGRTPTADEERAAAQVGLVSASTARLYWGSTSPLGKHLQTPWLPRPYEIIGVTNDTRYSPAVAQVPTLYVPMWLERPIPMRVVVRSSLPGTTLAALLDTAVLDVEPHAVVDEPIAYASQLRRWRARPAFFAQVFGAASALALVLAALALTAIARALLVARRRETGLRLAVGEPPPRVAARLLARATAAVLAGAPVGLAVGRAIPMPVEADPAPWWMPAGTLVAGPAVGLILVLFGVYVSCLRTVTHEPARLLREE
jgi:putative ABC transport system permease protein